jgi:predicted anti-sigma-YlaC factor YlaD
MQTDPHRSIRHIIDRSLAGEISPTEQHSLREHLHECAPCQKYADDSSRAIAALGEFSFTANPDLQPRVFTALAQRAQQLEATQPGRRRIARTCIIALLLTAVGSLAALHLGSPLAGLLHMEPAEAHVGVLALWVLPSLCFSLLLPVVLLLSARSATTKGSVL